MWDLFSIKFFWLSFFLTLSNVYLLWLSNKWQKRSYMWYKKYLKTKEEFIDIYTNNDRELMKNILKLRLKKGMDLMIRNKTENKDIIYVTENYKKNG